MSGNSIPLYNLAGLSSAELDKLLADIRSTDYIQEVTSGEVEPQASGLWDQVLPVPTDLHPSSLKGASSAQEQEEIAKHALSVLDSDSETKGKYVVNGIVVADERTKSGDGSLLVIELVGRGADKTVRDTMRCAPRSLIEVYKSMAGNPDVFDAGQ
ncbi:hypothetical protein OC861_000274 [Tilletia horrida]|nr:hypothetical protein OC861_000274 [Tilletia horrida]